jgi:uncharacterized protein YbbK (DUF523 family)
MPERIDVKGLPVMEKVLISSCLLGNPVRYNGQDAKVESEIINKWLAEGRAISVCPELFAIPRPPAEIIGANGYAVLDGFAVVLDDRGSDITRQYVAGAQEVLSVAQRIGARVAVLKDGSPSCGRTYIYNGQFRGVMKRGEAGVTSALLQRNGVAVFSEHQILEAQARLIILETSLRAGA